MNSNWTTAIHLARTEILRNLWFIVVLWLLPFIPEAVFFTVLLAGVLSARFAFELHPTRTTAHWRMRPASWRVWSTTLLILATIVFALPAALHQMLAGWQVGFDLGAIFWSVIEIVLKTLCIVSAVFAFAIVAGNAPKTLLLIVAVLLTTFLIVSLTDPLIEFQAPSLYGSPEQQPNPMMWWFAWLTMLGMGLAIIGYFAIKQRRRPAIFLLFGFTLVGLFIVLLADDFSSSHNKAASSLQAKLTEIANPDATAPEQNEQRLYANASITGLPDGAFVELRQWELRGTQSDRSTNDWEFSTHGDDSEWNANFAKRALWNLLAPEHRVLTNSYDNTLSPYRGRSPLNPEQAIGRRELSGLSSALKIEGHVFRWVELGEMPFANESKRLRRDVFAKLHREEIDGWNRGGRSPMRYRLHLFWPKLGLSPSVTEYALNDERLRMERLAVVANHADLNESVVLFTKVRRYLQMSQVSSTTPFGLCQTESHLLEILPNPNWRILYPEGDFTEQWLKGATLKIFVPDYLGRFDDELILGATVEES